jgi:peptidyl-prolyl cis-trans isomerase D
MLTTIREKAQGAFAWLILIAITVPFALWGIQNYIDAAKESPVASVGKKDFYQRDVNKAYEQFSQAYKGMAIDEQLLKKQALDKLIKDEVLLQYANNIGLVATDSSTRAFIKTLPYFQTDGKFDENKYKAMLNSQRMSSTDFISKIKSAQMMEQFQRSILDSSFITQYTLDNFFKIQNQQRDADYLTILLNKTIQQPTEQEINTYYQQHQDAYKTPEQVSIEYLELSLPEIAQKVEVTDDKLKTYYEEQKDQYTKPERRKISHILFAINSKTDDKAALAKAEKAETDLKTKDFAVLAGEISDDKLTALKGGDLGLLVSGSFDKKMEEAAKALKAGEVSKPVRSSFGYHLIKVTELTPVEIKPFDAVKAELSKNYQKAQAENIFYETGEKLTELSYENPDNLQTVSQALSLPVKKTTFFTKEKGDGIAVEPKIRDMAFSEEVLKGNNSAPVELSAERVAVLRVLEHRPAAVQDLNTVKQSVIAAITDERAKKQAQETAAKVKQRLVAGEAIQKVAAYNKLEIKSVAGLSRNDIKTVPEPVNDAIFKAAKPVGNKPTIVSIALANGEQTVISVKKVTPGAMSEEDKKKLEIAKKNIAAAFGQTEFNGMLETLQAKADVKIKQQNDKQ